MGMWDEPTLKEELRGYLRGKDSKVRAQAIKRIQHERALLAFGEACNWERETVISYCVTLPSAWLGRSVFEESFDNGSMRQMAKEYAEIAIEFGL